jgi:hypothetical protein
MSEICSKEMPRVLFVKKRGDGDLVLFTIKCPCCGEIWETIYEKQDDDLYVMDSFQGRKINVTVL